MIQVTEKPKQKVAEILSVENKVGQGLRVQVMGGGCSGFQYGLTFAESAGPTDTVVDCGSFKIYVDPVSSQYLDKATVVDLSLKKYGAPIYVRHEIVHSRHVVNSLRHKGAVFVEELNEVPEGSVVIFSAHGVANRCGRRRRAAACT